MGKVFSLAKSTETCDVCGTRKLKSLIKNHTIMANLGNDISVPCSIYCCSDNESCLHKAQAAPLKVLKARSQRG